MEHVGRAAPVGQGDHDELVDRAGEQRAELANPRVVRAIAPAGGERALVEPHDVAPLQPAVARDGADDRQAQGAERRFLRRGLGGALRLPHVAQDEPAVARDRGVAHVQRVQPDLLAGRQAVHVRAGAAQQREESLVLGHRPGEVGAGRVAQVPPLTIEARVAAERVTRVFHPYAPRIDALDRKGPALRAVLEVNPDALAQAEALDAERKAKGPRGPLHGVPVLVKDNIATRDRMQSTAGSLALVGVAPPRDAFIVERLRASGAVILGKANLSEWANFRSTHSSSGWSGRGGQCRNPYALDRTPSGSSSGSGVAVAANLCPVAIGTETDGSIVSPSTCCGIVGIKPTLGLVSRVGIVPIAHSQDTAAPMARSVADAAILLGVLAGVDAHDEATAASAGRSRTEYTSILDPAGLKGARLGVCRSRFMGYSAGTDAA